MQSPEITPLSTDRAQLGESPVWDAAAGVLICIDSRTGTLFETDAATGQTRSHPLPAPVGSVALARGNMLVAALRGAVVLVDRATGQLRELAQTGVNHPDVRLNDGKADPDGAFVTGTMHINRAAGQAPLGGLYRLSPTGVLSVLDTGIGVSNGPAFTPDGRGFYLADSAARRIWHYRRARDGSLQGKTLFADTQALGSAPDGAALDTGGGLWVAMVHIGAVLRFDPQGRVDRRIDLPLPHPTSLAFGGPDLRDLFVTSIRDSGRISSDAPLSGGVLRLRGLGVQGAPVFTAAFG